MGLFMLTGCWQDRDGPVYVDWLLADRDGTLYVAWLLAGSVLPTAGQHKGMTHTNCCTYRVVPPDDEQ
jgi:hypothetical protein